MLPLQEKSSGNVSVFVAGVLCSLSGFDRAHLVKPTDKADFRFATPPLPTPGEALGESVNLIVVATGKSEQLSNEFFQPSGALGKTD